VAAIVAHGQGLHFCHDCVASRRYFISS
jgi:hypothetical protein